MYHICICMLNNSIHHTYCGFSSVALRFLIWKKGTMEDFNHVSNNEIRVTSVLSSNSARKRVSVVNLQTIPLNALKGWVSSPRSGVPQTVRSWWPSPWGCRSWRTGPNTSPDRWPSQGIHTLCYRSRACISPGRRQSSPGKQTHASFRTSCTRPCDLESIKIQVHDSNTISVEKWHSKSCRWSLTMQRTGVIMVQLHFIHGFGL